MSWRAASAVPRSPTWGLLGASEAGDELIVNVQARDLGLGSGGFDIVHVEPHARVLARGGDPPTRT